MKTAKVIFSPSARADLFELYEYITLEAGLHRAGVYVERIEAACMALSMFPERGRRRENLAPGLRTIGFERRATILYRVEGEVVVILAVAYGGRDFEGELRDQE